MRAITGLRENYVWWKLGSTCLLGLILCVVPLLRTLAQSSMAFAALTCGILFVASTATALGVTTANPKTFIVGFLTFWYVVVNDRGMNALLDFAGFYGHATTATIFLYGTISIGTILLAQIFYRVRLTRS